MAVAKASSKHVLQIAKNIHQRRLAADPAISWTDAQQPVLEQTSHFAMTQAANAVTSYEALAVSRTRLLELNTGIQADENINDAYKAKAARLVRAYQPVSGAYAAAPQHYNCLAAELMARDIGPKKGCVYGFNHSIFDMNQVVEPEAQDPAVLAIRQHVPEQLTPAQRAHIDASERLVLFSAAIKEASAARFPRPVQA
jgi:hypothetical protein